MSEIIASGVDSFQTQKRITGLRTAADSRENVFHLHLKLFSTVSSFWEMVLYRRKVGFFN